MTKTFSILGSIALLIAAVLGIQVVYGAVTAPVPTRYAETYVPPVTLLSATTTSATSTNLAAGGGSLVVAGAKKVSILFSRGGATGPNAGQSVFQIEGSIDGDTFFDVGRLMRATSTAQTLESTITLQGTSSVLIALDLEYDALYSIRCIVREITDGDHTCKAATEF